MAERDIKVEDAQKDIHDEGGDDEVRAGSSYDSPALEPELALFEASALKSLESCHLKQILMTFP